MGSEILSTARPFIQILSCIIDLLLTEQGDLISFIS